VYLLLKIIFDYIFSLILLIILIPLFLFISIILIIEFGRNIFFFQERQGYKGKIFNIIKFKTMNDATDQAGNLKSDKERITKIGKLLRKYSIDELPTLFNILLGQMSFVGPRPVLAEYDKFYTQDQRKRFLVKPGITGWAQVNGRNKISWEEKFNLDIWYIRNRGFLLDLKIIFMTIMKIFRNKDVDFDESVVDIKFQGSDEDN
tara:strand:- start:429 stop:1040 length:612 start_codon:yes stop_codon:yes gene_type:complete